MKISKLTLIACLFAMSSMGFVWARANQSAAPPESEVVVVKMTADHLFSPDNVAVKVGQTIEWQNTEPGGLHQVTNDPDIANEPSDVSMPEGAKPFDSHMMRTGKTFQLQFTVPGEYRYVCPPHEMSGMIGKITVTK